MRKQFEKKRWGSIFAFFALISLVLLASTLRGLDLRPAQPFGRGLTTETVESAEVKQILIQAMEAPLGNPWVFLGGLFLIGLTIYLLLSPELRKQFIRRFLRMGAIAMLLYYVLRENPDILIGLLSGLLLLPLSLKEISEVSPTADLAPPVFQPPHISPVLSYVITFGLILMAILFIWTLNRWWAKQKEIMAARPSLTKIAAIARVSLKELETGSNSDDAIIQCYERMSHVISSRQGLRRENAMTPSEFAARLERSGLPREAVVRLTHLFESVRYGGHVTGPREISEAISCLTSILKYCGDAL